MHGGELPWSSSGGGGKAVTTLKSDAGGKRTYRRTHTYLELTVPARAIISMRPSLLDSYSAHQ